MHVEWTFDEVAFVVMWDVCMRSIIMEKKFMHVELGL